MMIQYFTVDGRCLIEKSNIDARYIEMRDGYHPITNDSVWQDDTRMRPPILAIFEGVTPPLGADMTDEDLETLLKEIELIKLGFKKPSVSKMFWRALVAFGQWFKSYAIPIGVGLTIVYFGYLSFMGA